MALDSETSTGQPQAPPIADLVDDYLEAKAKGQRTGAYRTLADSALGRWRRWLTDRDISGLEEIGTDAMRAFAQDLRSDVRDGELTASSALTYYGVVRACLSWAVEDGRLVENPAAASRATSELPEDTSDPSRQFWTAEQVAALLADASDRVDDALDEGGRDAAATPLRDRALVSLLAATGVRGAEVFRSSDDDRPGRQGLRWKRVDIDAGTLSVLGKSQEWEHAQLPEQAATHLRRHREAQRPASGEWPVFPTGHTPSKHRAVRSALSERGWSTGRIDEALSGDVDAVLRAEEIAPPALTVRGARSVIKRLCEQADVEVDGEYLKPHGARRGLGDTLYRESAELAQAALRHSSVRTTHDAYAHIEASETADTVGEVLGDAFGGDAGNRE